MKFRSFRRAEISGRASARAEARKMVCRLFEDARTESLKISQKYQEVLTGQGMEVQQAHEVGLDFQFDIYWLILHEVLVEALERMNPSLSEEHVLLEHLRDEA